jgi:hypothetical protein
MRNRFLILSLAVATLFACNNDSMVSDDFNKTAVERPFKIKKVEGTFALGPGDASCGPVVLNANGEGTVSHLGQSSVFEEWCFNGETSNLGTRTITFTAANGDLLVGEIQTFKRDGFTFTEEVDIIPGRGTGRFATAEGSFTQIINISFETEFSGTFTYSAVGTIIY